MYGQLEGSFLRAAVEKFGEISQHLTCPMNVSHCNPVMSKRISATAVKPTAG